MLRSSISLVLLLLLPLFTGACRAQAPAEQDLGAVVAELLPRLQTLAGLEVREQIRFDRRDREQLRDYVIRQIEENLPPAELEGLGQAYAAFGLIPDSLDLRALVLELYAEQVLGYYDPEAETLYVMDGVPADALRPVLAHELVHALQDQHADLEALMSRKRGNDRQGAAQAAIEGHAMLVMVAWTMESQTGGAVDVAALPDMRSALRPALEAQNEQMPVFRDAPRIIRETMLFPYLGGASFVQTLWRERGGRAGAVSHPAPFGSLMPLSSEHVLHPETKFLGERDMPLELELEPQAGGWSVAYENTLGELEVGILLEEHLGPEAGAQAAGWDGDRYRLLRGPDGLALIWYSVWDSPEAADAFADAYRRILAARAGRAGRVERLEVDGHPAVRVIDAETGVSPDAVPVVRALSAREVAR